MQEQIEGRLDAQLFESRLDGLGDPFDIRERVQGKSAFQHHDRIRLHQRASRQ